MTARFERKPVMIVRDPKGNPLARVLLRVIERDERGPRLLRYCYDDETIGLAAEGGNAVDPANPKVEFLITWSPTMAETSVAELKREAARAADNMFGEEIDKLEHDLEQLRASHAKLTASDEDKTLELRMLHQERDPKRFETAVRERVEAATLHLTAKLREADILAANQKREIEELKRGKKKLREALDRLKDAT